MGQSRIRKAMKRDSREKILGTKKTPAKRETEKVQEQDNAVVNESMSKVYKQKMLECNLRYKMASGKKKKKDCSTSHSLSPQLPKDSREQLKHASMSSSLCEAER
ncbi:hypothetical protein C5167_042312 [Papaver somniferum]|uniref:Uncharacterized protein n=1 Tax=Papaver somniferum TaxID=3469 RepID=A0A4Y7L3H6_PAPSO|nr:hypothetical protein C5167_042312 [Papaver somniferum]